MKKNSKVLLWRAIITTVLLLPVAAISADRMSSSPVPVFLSSQKSSFWHTATNRTMTVPVEYPANAVTASLTVTGLDYNRVYENIPEGDFTFTLPEAVDLATENVSDLTLRFENSSVVRTVRLGLVTGAQSGGMASTRCLAPSDSRQWRGVKSRMVLPIPYGVETIGIGSETLLTGLGGAQGWFALERLGTGVERTVGITANGILYESDLFGKADGMTYLLR